MSTLAETVSAAPVVSRSNDVPRSVPAAVQRELERLAAQLLGTHAGVATHPGAYPGCFVMVDVEGSDRSSLWLATGVASILGERLHKNVHVVSTDRAAREKPASASAPRSSTGGSCTLEHVGGSSSEERGNGAWAERLDSLRLGDQPAVLHLASTHDLPDLLLRGRAIDGVLLLVRASRTRRAALETMVHRLTQAGLPLLGCVLLDRIHPVPEKLYRLL